MDERTTVGELRDLVRRFVRQRDWEQFHTPKNLSMGVAIEAAELMELFQWPDADAGAAQMRAPRTRRAVQDELADVLIYCLAFANHTGIDLARAVRVKLREGRRRYPVREYRGRFTRGIPTSPARRSASPRRA